MAKATSPYYDTPVSNDFLDVMVNRKITKSPSDKLYTIDVTYNLRPDMLANDLYGDPALWWVFAARNPDVLMHPLFDFVTGVSIFIVPESTLQSDLGV